MADRLDKSGRELLFLAARSHNAWLDRPVPESLLHELYALMKMAPTSANGSPARIVFLRGETARARLKPCLFPGNLEKTLSAPVTAIIAHDLQFYDQLPKLMPHTDARSWFSNAPAKAGETAFRNGSLQGAYFIMAARAVGLDCGPMSGFDNAALDAEFFASGELFPGQQVKSNFLCNLGYGDCDQLFPRHPRLAFDEACVML